MSIEVKTVALTNEELGKEAPAEIPNAEVANTEQSPNGDDVSIETKSVVVEDSAVVKDEAYYKTLSIASGIEIKTDEDWSNYLSTKNEVRKEKEVADEEENLEPTEIELMNEFISQGKGTAEDFVNATKLSKVEFDAKLKIVKGEYAKALKEKNSELDEYEIEVKVNEKFNLGEDADDDEKEEFESMIDKRFKKINKDKLDTVTNLYNDLKNKKVVASSDKKYNKSIDEYAKSIVANKKWDIDGLEIEQEITDVDTHEIAKSLKDISKLPMDKIFADHLNKTTQVGVLKKHITSLKNELDNLRKLSSEIDSLVAKAKEEGRKEGAVKRLSSIEHIATPKAEHQIGGEYNCPKTGRIIKTSPLDK